MKLFKCVVALLSLSIVTNTHAADVLSYTLQPGSTITPLYFGTPIGPTEDLTGSFDWVQFTTTNENPVGFDATRLEFRSTSFVIGLNTTVNDRGTSVFANSCLTYLGEVVDTEGLGTPVGEMSSYDSDGCYSGPPDHPTSLSYPEVRIAPLGGGLFVARLTIIAALADADADHDGINDDVDLCLNSDPGAVVDAQGCSITQLVPCGGSVSGGAWKNHGKYVSEVVIATKVFVSAGLIDDRQKDATVEAAAQSDCGKK